MESTRHSHKGEEKLDVSFIYLLDRWWESYLTVPLLPLPPLMADDAALKTCLLWLAALMLAVGLCTHSPHKMLATYILGVLGIAGVLLPDWDYFNRDFSRWPYPVTADERASFLSHGSAFIRFAHSPLRLIAYSAIYGYAIYKWWEYVSDDS